MCIRDRGSKFTKKKRVVRDKFPDGEIYAILAEQKLTRGEKVVDNLLGILTDAPFGIPSPVSYTHLVHRDDYQKARDLLF